MRTMSDFVTIADIGRLQAKARPEATALWFNGRITTYAELNDAANRCANALIAAGVKPGDRVSCMAKNDDEFFTLWMGAARARACLAPVNWRLAPPEAARGSCLSGKILPMSSTLSSMTVQTLSI
jgi:acyl-CoA synthetase (AMP-forming)/AMP-acid ligase II